MVKSGTNRKKLSSILHQLFSKHFTERFSPDDIVRDTCTMNVKGTKSLSPKRFSILNIIYARRSGMRTKVELFLKTENIYYQNFDRIFKNHYVEIESLRENRSVGFTSLEIFPLCFTPRHFAACNVYYNLVVQFWSFYRWKNKMNVSISVIVLDAATAV